MSSNLQTTIKDVLNITERGPEPLLPDRIQILWVQSSSHNMLKKEERAAVRQKMWLMSELECF